MRYEQPPAADRETADLALMGSRNADTEPLEREGASDQHSAMPKAEAPVDPESPRRKVLHRKTEAAPARCRQGPRQGSGAGRCGLEGQRGGNHQRGRPNRRIPPLL